MPALSKTAVLTAAATLLSLVIGSHCWVGGAASSAPVAPRQMEKLGRGVVAISQGDGKVFVDWRMLATDAGKCCL
jgi:rhamnogalacturonan endolyase